jgi:hypothetical protein
VTGFVPGRGGRDGVGPRRDVNGARARARANINLLSRNDDTLCSLQSPLCFNPNPHRLTPSHPAHLRTITYRTTTRDRSSSDSRQRPFHLVPINHEASAAGSGPGPSGGDSRGIRQSASVSDSSPTLSIHRWERHRRHSAGVGCDASRRSARSSARHGNGPTNTARREQRGESRADLELCSHRAASTTAVPARE